MYMYAVVFYMLITYVRVHVHIRISAQSGFEAIKGKAFDEYIDTKNAAFIKRIGDLREK